MGDGDGRWAMGDGLGKRPSASAVDLGYIEKIFNLFFSKPINF